METPALPLGAHASEAASTDRYLVSILTPVHNEEAHLPEMLESVRAQSHTNWEVLIVDDGSDDATARVAAAHAAVDPRVRLVASGTKLGKTAAFNAAFAASRGDIVCLAAGDDTLPPDSLAERVGLLAEANPSRPLVAYGKLRTFSEDPKFDAIELPKGDHASRSGGSITLTRAAAQQVFPIPDGLPSEDTWTRFVAEHVAEEILLSTKVFLNYRIHAGNSHSRSAPFAEYSRALHDRARVWNYLLADGRFGLNPDIATTLRHRLTLEEYRWRGRVVRILAFREVPLVDRVATASLASPLLYRLRMRFYGRLTGRRKA